MRRAHPGRVTRTLALAQLANSIGDGGFLVTSALYFTRVVGLSVPEVGVGLTVGWAVGLLLSPVAGWVADRRGLRGTAVALALLTAVALAALLGVREFRVFVPVVCAYGIGQSALSSVRQALLARLVTPEQRVATRARLQAVLNAGLGVGALLGGVALALDRPEAYLSVFALDAAAFLLAAVLLTRLPAVPAEPPPVAAEPGAVGVLRDGPYAAATALNAVMLLYMPMLSVVLPLWIADRTTAPTATVAALFVLNTVGVAVGQVRVARTVTGLGSAAVAVRRAGLLLLASCAVFATAAVVAAPAGAVAVLLAGAVLQVLGEMLLGAGSWEIGFGLAPSARPGLYQGVFGTGTPVARTVGPLALTTLVIGGGVPGWLALGAVFAVAGAATSPVVRRGLRDPWRSAHAGHPAGPAT